MRRYDDPVDVHRGLVTGQEAPAEFWWRGKRWAVRAVVAHWLETGAWWEQSGVAALLGAGHGDDETSRDVTSAATRRQNRGFLGVSAEGELLVEREMWRVEAILPSYSGIPGRAVDSPDRPVDSAYQAVDSPGRPVDPSQVTSCRDASSAATRRQNCGFLGVSAEGGSGFGVFELCFDWAGGEWRLTGSVD